MYEEGRGVLWDDKEAVKWYRKAALQGDALAQANLGRMYYEGRVPIVGAFGISHWKKDYAKAVEWHRKSAEQGNAHGQVGLEWMYEKGLGVRKNEKEAVKWYRKAPEQGEAFAKRKLKERFKENPTP